MSVANSDLATNLAGWTLHCMDIAVGSVRRDRENDRFETASRNILTWHGDVIGNRPADEMRTEDQSMCRRVRLTVRLGGTMTEDVDDDGYRQSDEGDTHREEGDARRSKELPMLVFKRGERGFKQRKVNDMVLSFSIP
jgi:hypothetical protein